MVKAAGGFLATWVLTRKVRGRRCVFPGFINRVGFLTSREPALRNVKRGRARLCRQRSSNHEPAREKKKEKAKATTKTRVRAKLSLCGSGEARLFSEPIGGGGSVRER